MGLTQNIFGPTRHRKNFLSFFVVDVIMAGSVGNVVRYEGCSFFRQKIILSTLSGKSVKIKKMRHLDESPGISDFEADVLRLIEKVSKGVKIQLSETGTNIYYQPGMLNGGHIEHDCNTERSLGYYLEFLLCLAPFMKKPLHAILRGVTNDRHDPSVDLIKFSTLPVLKKFMGISEGFEIKVIKRGSAPDGGGEILFTCPVRLKLTPVNFTEQGKIKKIRGVAWATRVSSDVCRRMTDKCREVLRKCLADIFISTDYRKGSEAGRSPGFGMTLVAEATNGVFLCAEVAANPKGSNDGPTVPEDLGLKAALSLLDEISRGGCVDSSNQSLACLMMVLGDKDVSKIQMGPLTDYTIAFLRHLRDFFGVIFKIDENSKHSVASDDNELLQKGEEKLTLTCTGIGYKNLNKVLL